MIVIILGRAAQFILALATLRFSTTLLSPEELGKVSLVVTTTAFFAMFLVNPVGMFINRRLHAWQAKGSAKYYLKRYTLYLGLVAMIAALSLPLLAMTEWLNFEMPVMWLIALVCMSLIFNTINQTAIPSLNMLGYSRTFVVLSVCTLATSLICAVALVKVVNASAPFWVLGLLIGQTLLAAVGVKALFSKLRSDIVQPNGLRRLPQKQLRVLIEFAWPVALAAGLAWVQGQGFRYILESQLGLAQLGLFVAGYGISVGLTAGFESILTTYFQPRLYRDASATSPQSKTEVWHRYADAVVPSLVLTLGLLIALAPDLTRLLLGERFQDAESFVIWGAFAEAARVLASVYSLIAHVNMRTRWLIWPNVAGASSSIVGCAFLIPVLGANGAGLALAVAGVLTILTMHFALLKKVGARISLRPIVISMALMPAMVMLAVFLRQSLPADQWIGPLLTCSITGLAFLYLQYLLLCKHLDDPS